MSSKESTFSFVYDWMKNSGTSSSFVVVLRFSEGLLNTLYYQTDIGSIPRGTHPESYPTSQAKYQNNPNWSKHIMGCYWCGRDSTVVNGICCSKDCINYLHEWCVERVELFQGRRFCKLPGCELSPTEAKYVCCNRSHNREYEQMFEFVNKKQLRDLVIKGPYWYNCEHSFDKTPPVLTHYTPETALRDLNKQMKSILTNTENIGKSNKHSTPDITGLNIQDMVNTPQHSKHSQHSQHSQHSPYMKIMKSVTNPVPCPIQSQYSAVPNLPISKSLTTQYNQNENIFTMNPYTNLPQSSRLTENLTTEIVLPKVTSKIPKKIVVSEKNDQNKLSSSLALIAGQMKVIDSADTPTNPELFSQKLTSLLRQHTDIGVIPRVTDAICSETAVSGCYWCESSQTSYNVVACSSRCWYLLHEWCVRKVEHVCKLCVVPGCEKTRIPGCNCCSIPHIKQLSKLRGDLIGTEEEVELILGPIWHEDRSPISFSSKQGPFYELSNFYCCSIQVKNTWPTVYHYLCSQQLCGTPYYRHIPQIESIRELNTFMDSSCVVKWVRPDWNSVKKKLTYIAMLHKFRQNSILRRLLLSTNNRQLVCTDGATPVDTLVSVRWCLNVIF